MSYPTINRALYVLAALAGAALTALGMQLVQGKVPIPEAYQWVVPILVAVITTSTALLPRVGGEPVAAQVDLLKATGSHRRNMAVVDVTKLETVPPFLYQQVSDELERRMKETPAGHQEGAV